MEILRKLLRILWYSAVAVFILFVGLVVVLLVLSLLFVYFEWMFSSLGSFFIGLIPFIIGTFYEVLTH